MNTIYYLYTIGLVTTTILSISLAFISWQRRNTPGVKSFIILTICAGIWALFQSLEVISITTAQKILWARLEYFGIAPLGVAWLLFTLDYTRHRGWVNWQVLSGLLVIPAITIGLVWTNDWHQLVWSSIRPNLNSNGFILIFGHGLWWYFQIIYTYLCLLAGICVLIWAVLHSPGLYRLQVVIILGGIAVPVMYNIFYMSGIEFIQGMDLTPFMFNVACLIYVIGINQLRLFDLVPVARAMLLEHIHENIFVIDSLFRVVDINPATARLLHKSTNQVIGQDIDKVFAGWPELSSRCRVNVDTSFEVNLPASYCQADSENSGGSECLYDVRVTPLYERKHFTGSVIVMRDITDRKRREESERQQRVLAEALRDTAMALNSTLDLEEVFDLILENLDKVMPNDASTIMLDDQGIARIVRHHGYFQRNMGDEISRFTLNINDTLNLHSMSVTHQPSLIAFTAIAPEWVITPHTAWVKSYIGAPIIIQGKAVGFLNLVSATPGYFTDAQKNPLVAFANQVAIAIRNANLYQKVERLATIDDLTGLPNRRALFDNGRRAVEFAIRHQKPLSTLFIDIDHFKAYNDRFSYAVGDAILREFSLAMSRHLRSTDMIGRYGGEEFVVLLPETELSAAVLIAERLRQMTQALPVPTDRGQQELTVSIGVSLLTPNPGLANKNPIQVFTELIDSASQVLKHVKNDGGNRVLATHHEYSSIIHLPVLS